MKIQHPNDLNNRANWLKSPVNSGAFRHYLIDKGSLTRRLQLQSQQFSVKPVRLRQAKALQDEAALLRLRQQQHALLREVLLVCDGTAVVFAHSILPKQSLRGEWRALGHLGNKPLGATLFANPKVQRTPLTYKKLSSHHKLYKRMQQANVLSELLANQPFSQALWARRSVFSLNKINLGHAKILVTEVFLPSILNL